MTIEQKAEEINKKAEKHCNEVLCNAHEKCNEVIKCRDWRARRAGFFCGYEQAVKDLQKENYIQEQIIIGDQIEHNEEVNRLKQEIKNLRDNYELYKAAAEPTIDELQNKVDQLQGYLDHNIEYDIEQENLKLKEDIKTLSQKLEDTEIINKALEKQNEVLKRRIARAKDCMKSFIYIAKSEHFNCKGLIKNAEDFIYDRMCPIRKQGQHCITEKPCIMCDRS